MSRRGGVVTGLVHAVDAEQGRVKVIYQDIEQSLLSHWAYVAAPLSGPNRGMLFMPEKGDEVLVCFADDDFDHPYVVGFLWNGKQKSPETKADNRVIVTPGGHQLRFEDKKNDTRVLLKSNGKHQLLFEDKAGSEHVELKSNASRTVLLDDSGTGKVEVVSGNNKVLLDDSPAGTKVELRAGQGLGVTITMNATPQPSLSISIGAGNTLDISADGMRLNLTGTLNVTGGGAANVNIGGAANVTVGGAANMTVGGAVNLTTGAAMNLTCGIFNVNAGITNFSGVVRAPTVIAQAVVGNAYTPGVGNLI